MALHSPELNFATYIGSTTRTSDLATTDLPLTQLPITGYAARESIPFGDSSVTLVTSPRGPLGGEFRVVHSRSCC